MRFAVPRRALGGLALGVTACLAAGCEVADLRGLRAPRSTPADPGAAGDRPPGAGDPDGVVVERVVAALRAAHAEATAVGTVPELAPAAGTFAALHAAHLAELEAQPSASAASSATPTSASLRRRERSLQKELATAATEVESGTLARHLAAMSAAVAQRLAQPTPPGAPR